MTDIKDRAKQWAIDREKEAKVKEARFGRKPPKPNTLKNSDFSKSSEDKATNKI